MEHNIQQTSKYNTIRYRWACVSIRYSCLSIYISCWCILGWPFNAVVRQCCFYGIFCVYLPWMMHFGTFLCWHGIHVMIPRKNMRPFDENPCIHNWRHLHECLFVGEGINIQFKCFNLNEYYLVIHDCLLLWRQFMRKKWHGIHVKTYCVC